MPREIEHTAEQAKMDRQGAKKQLAHHGFHHKDPVLRVIEDRVYSRPVTVVEFLSLSGAVLESGTYLACSFISSVGNMKYAQVTHSTVSVMVQY